MSADRDDVYVSIEADGEYLEKHIYASTDEAQRLEEALVKRMRDLGYPDDAFAVTVESGGDYHWIVDDATDLTALAGEIVAYGGFAKQEDVS